jgi:predicted RNA-binding protein YlqC (UPF0109 family)
MIGFLKKLFGCGCQNTDFPKRTPNMDDVEALKTFVEFICCRLVDYPNKVSVSVKEDEKVVALQITCEKTDVGKIVGKSGKTIAAIRALVSGAGGRLGRKALVEVLD